MSDNREGINIAPSDPPNCRETVDSPLYQQVLGTAQSLADQLIKARYSVWDRVPRPVSLHEYEFRTVLRNTSILVKDWHMRQEVRTAYIAYQPEERQLLCDYFAALPEDQRV